MYTLPVLSTATPQGLRGDLPDRPKLPRYFPSVECHDLVFIFNGDIHDGIGVDTDANRVFKLLVSNIYGGKMLIMFVFDHTLSDSIQHTFAVCSYVTKLVRNMQI